MVGWPGLKRVEYWLRPDAGTHGKLADDDPAWADGGVAAVRASSPPPDDWGGSLPDGVPPKDVWGFDADRQAEGLAVAVSASALWSVTLHGPDAGRYELRVRTVDLNGFAQPEPRPYQKSGRNDVQCKQFVVMA